MSIDRVVVRLEGRRRLNCTCGQHEFLRKSWLGTIYCTWCNKVWRDPSGLSFEDRDVVVVDVSPYVELWELRGGG